jgi:hypothetical protein
MSEHFVYIMANHAKTLYTGVTGLGASKKSGINQSRNPDWIDLSTTWVGKVDPSPRSG